MATDKQKKRRPSRTEERAVAKALEKMAAEGVELVPSARSKQPHKKERREREKKRRLKRRAEEGGSVHCLGKNFKGEPCKSPTLKPGTIVDGSPPVTGNFCIMHDPDVDPSQWKKRFRGTKDGKTARYMTPVEALAEAFAVAPHLLFKPHLEALGLEWDEETGEISIALDANGKPRRGATVIGFSREGVAKKSRYKDITTHMKAADTLSDRMFGKARQAMDLGIGSAEAPKIPASGERAAEVTNILQEAGAL